MAREVGTVKWFAATKGFGFIQPDQGGDDVFVHQTTVEQAGIRELQQGTKVSYERLASKQPGKFKAVQLQLAS